MSPRTLRLLLLIVAVALGLTGLALGQEPAPAESVAVGTGALLWVLALAVLLALGFGSQLVVLGLLTLVGTLVFVDSRQSVHEAIAESTVAAEKAQMRQHYVHFMMHLNANDQRWPRGNGQAFLLELWWEGTVRRTQEEAERFFSASENATEYLALLGLDPHEQSVVEYLSDRSSLMPGMINYAALDTRHDPSLRARMMTHPHEVTILANATFAHRNAIVYMTADGAVHALQIDQLLEQGLLHQDDIDAGIVPVGPSSPIPQLRTVSND